MAILQTSCAECMKYDRVYGGSVHLSRMQVSQILHVLL